jgi:hypothetical protein
MQKEIQSQAAGIVAARQAANANRGQGMHSKDKSNR